MTRLVWLAYVWLAMLSGAAVSGSYLWRSGAPQDTKDSVDGWVRGNYTRVLDLALRNRCSEDPVQARRAMDARWLACVRIVPAFKNENESSASLEKRYDGTLFAQLVRPKGHSVYVQLRERKKQQPSESPAGLAKLIEIESTSGDQRRFPGLSRLADEFEKMQVSPVLSDELMMDATEYRFSIRAPYGESLDLTLLGPGAAAPRQPPGLIQWAESLKETFATPR